MLRWVGTLHSRRCVGVANALSRPAMLLAMSSSSEAQYRHHARSTSRGWAAARADKGDQL